MADLTEALFTTPQMADLFSGAGHVRRMLDFEAALARAEARAGVIPAEAAGAITAACRVERFDVPGLLRETAVAGTLAIPLARALTGQVAGDVVGGAIGTAGAIATAPFRAMTGNNSYAMAPNASYCAQRYRSYDPASGTYMGYDGRRHPC